MADNEKIIELYTELAKDPSKDFGWDKGLENAKAHGYKKAWIDVIPSQVWEYCAAVGNPFKDANIKEGDVVLDLGCGTGVDVLVAAHLVGEEGKVYGVDITPKMVELATSHAKLANANNVNILESSFDTIDLEDESVDIVISNGAINLTSCKESVFAEIYRVLKPKGKLFFADMIDISEVSECFSLKQGSSCDSAEEDWANCVTGTMRECELIELIEKGGFENVACTGHTHYSTAETTKGATFKAVKTPSTILREAHWDGIFKKVDYTQVLWHQNSPKKSLTLIECYKKSDTSIIDVGCGTSFLVDELLKNGYKNVTLLDTSKTSLNITKERIQNKAIRFVCDDILHFKADKKFDIWHDRAVFHFLLSKKDRTKYFEVLSDILDPEGRAIISTFAMDGDLKCAGLNVVQYDEDKLNYALPKNLKLIESEAFTHITPRGTEQKYIFFVIKKMS